MFDVTLITPTGDRPGSFALLERWIGRKTFQGRMQWLVIDDGQVPTVCTMDQHYVRRLRQPTDPRHTLPVNLLEALPRIESDRVLIIEDDEWYAPEYVEFMSRHLAEIRLVGLRVSHYWCLRRRAWLELVHPRHASLCRTGFRTSMSNEVAAACRHMVAPVDLLLWRAWGETYGVLLDERGHLNASVKNVPGRRRLSRMGGWQPDPHGDVFASWSSREVADAYLSLQ